jgi:3-hydroxybutyryl-CoA dehydratase
MMGGQQRFKVGDDLFGPVRAITPQRIEWYDSAMLSAATNELRQVGSNIHTDEAFARSEGFPTVNADGMIMTNWCSEMLVRAFGMDYLERGELRTKYIKPVNLGVLLHVRGRIREATTQPNGNTLYTIDIWCEDHQGTKLVDGDAKVDVARD